MLETRKKRMVPLTDGREKGEKLISPQTTSPILLFATLWMVRGQIWPNGIVTIVMT
jgi:hypothetical protein